MPQTHTSAHLTVKSVRARLVVVPLKRPIVSKVGMFRDRPGHGVEWNEKAVAKFAL